MDLLQRLIAGSGSASSKQHRIATPSERLDSCRKLCNSLQNAWRSTSSLSNEDATAGRVANIIRRLNTILEDESRKAAPHSCLLYTASNQIYIVVAKLALSSSSYELISNATQFFHFLINGEAEGVLDSKIFARSLIDLVRRCIAPATKVVNEQEESALIELLFEICTKIRLDPGILPAWFYPERGPDMKSISPLESRRRQFPLFHLLIDYVHYDGSIGDFARMGLLYLTETAPRSPALEKWMMESDLAHQMASGLSALYGRLSRQTPKIKKSALPILAFSDGFDDGSVVNILDEYGGQDMRGFLAYLQFWQDALSRCQSSEVRDTLLDSFQFLFVEQLLYPSLLESSDVEGGSTSAVILHLCSLLEALEHPQLISRMLNYLFAAKSQPALSKVQKDRQRMSMSRRKSMEQLASLVQLADNPSPDLFSLLDLLKFSLRSSQSQTISASLRLVNVLLRRHHPFVRDQLFLLESMPQDSRQNLNSLNHTMLTLFDLAGTISQINSMDQSYQAALQDAQMGMERHSCLLDESTRTSPDLSILAVSQDCKIMEQLCILLSNWFFNDALVNLELTGILVNLASCEYVLMRSWLTPQNAIDEMLKHKGSSVLAIIGHLVGQIKKWRSQFVEWDAFYSIQKVEIASENEEPSLGKRTLSMSNKSNQSSEVQSASPRSTSDEASRGRLNMNVESIDSRVASSRENTIPDIPRSTSNRSNVPQHLQTGVVKVKNNQSDVLSATLLDTKIPIEPLRYQEDVRDNDLRDDSEEAILPEDPISTMDEQTDEPTKVEPNVDDSREQQTASLRHLLTQSIVLQEFILELAAALQIRATLFDEVDLS